MSTDRLLSLCGKVAVITGGARGIGAAVADLLGRAGADVAVVDTLDTSATVRALQGLGRKAIGYTADLRDEEQVIGTFDRIVTDFGRLDIVHNNAGIAYCKPCEEMSFAEWSMVTSIDLDAVFLVARTAGRILIAQGTGGVIINTASMSGSIVNYPQEQVAYNAAKAGVIQLTRSLACEWAKFGIRVNAVSPGYIATDMTPGESPPEWVDTWLAMCPTKRLGTPEEVAGAVLYLVSDLASFTTGANLVVDGGYSCY